MPFRLKARISDLVVDADLNMEGRNISNVGTLQGQKEVIAQEETLVKQTIVPTEAGGEALVVRDATNSVNRVLFREDGTGRVRELSVGDLIFAHGYRLTEVDGGIALVNPQGKTVKEWREV